MPVRVITPPAAEPVSLDEVKGHLRIEHALDDDYLGTAIAAARKTAEDYCNRGFVTQELELVLESFPEGGEIELPRGNLVTIVSVKYIDENGTEVTWASSNYVKDDTVEPGKLRLAYDKDWPSARCQWDAVKIRYTVGWDATGDEEDRVPAPIRHAIFLSVSQLYENRTPEVTGVSVTQLSKAEEWLLNPVRLVGF